MDQLHGSDERPVRSRTTHLHVGDGEDATLRRRRSSLSAGHTAGLCAAATGSPAPHLHGDGATLRRRRTSPSAGHVDGLGAAATGSPAPQLHGDGATLRRRRVSPNDIPTPTFGIRSSSPGSGAQGAAVREERRRFRPQRAVIRRRHHVAAGAPAPISEEGETPGDAVPVWEFYMERYRAGDSGGRGAVFRACGVHWIVRRRRCIRLAAAHGPPVGTSVPHQDLLRASYNAFLELPAVEGIKPLPPAGVTDVLLSQRRDRDGVPIRTITRSDWQRWLPPLLLSCAVRLGAVDASEVLLPRAWTWEALTYPHGMQQTCCRNGRGEGSCTLCSVAMCVHARYRLAFERRHGVGSFPFQLAMDMRYLKAACRRAGIWRPVKKGTSPQMLLKLMDSHAELGIRTERLNGEPGPLVRPSSSALFSGRLSPFLSEESPHFSHLDTARLLRLGGPVVGVLYVDDTYLRAVDVSSAYTGAPLWHWPNHTTLCVGYHISEKDGMSIQVRDNQTSTGPLLWVRYEWFEYFAIVEVELEDGRIRAMLRWVASIARRLASLAARWTGVSYVAPRIIRVARGIFSKLLFHFHHKHKKQIPSIDMVD